MKPIHIFKTGTHTDSHGQTLTFSESDLADAVRAYNPDLHQAPIVVGHPKADAPAFGWVQSLSSQNGNLFATPEQVNPEFSEQVKAGSYKKVSASFYPPTSPANPVKGVYYLRHVGFLGAEPPAIKGLQPIEFSEQDDAVTLTLDFSETQASTKQNKKSAFDSVVSALHSLFFGEQATVMAETDTPVNPAMTPPQQSKTEPNAETKQKDNNMSDANTTPNDQQTQQSVSDDAVAQKDAEIAQLKQKLAEKEKAEAQAKIDAEQKANSDFAEGLVNDGKLAPANKDMVVAVLNAIDTANRAEPLAFNEWHFGEGDGAKPLAEAFKDSLSNATTYSHLFSESATKANPSTGKHDFNAPKGAVVDGDALAKHQEILAYAEAHGVDYATAAISLEG